MTKWWNRQIERYGTWLLIGLAIGLLSYVLLAKTPPEMADRAIIATAFFAGIAPFIAFIQAKIASQQTEKVLTADVRLRLYEVYTKDDVRQAIRNVWQAMKQEGKGVNNLGDFLEISDRYQFLKTYYNVHREELDRSRQTVTDFWYLIANLLELGTLKEHEVFEWFGPPDVIWVLEGLEVINQSHEMTSGKKKTRWPPLDPLKRYYRFQEIKIKALESTMIPIGRIDREVVERIKNL